MKLRLNSGRIVHLGELRQWEVYEWLWEGLRTKESNGRLLKRIVEENRGSDEAFESQDWLVHVLEEELLHLIQKARGLAQEFARGTALELELDVNDSRKFPPPSR